MGFFSDIWNWIRAFFSRKDDSPGVNPLTYERNHGQADDEPDHELPYLGNEAMDREYDEGTGKPD